jgi:dTMP kinase
MQREPRKADRMEQQSGEFYERVREGYRELAIHEPKRIVLINGSRGADEIEREIWAIVAERFPAVGTNRQSAIGNRQF